MNQREDTQGNERVERGHESDGWRDRGFDDRHDRAYSQGAAGRESERWNNGFERPPSRGPSRLPDYGYGQGGPSYDSRRDRGWEDRYGGERRYGRQPSGSQGYGPRADAYGFGQRTPWREPHEHLSSEEMFGRRPFGRPEDTHYYGTGAAGWGGPGFTGGAYAYGDGPRDQERQLESEYSDESAVSYEQQQRYGRYPTSRSRQYAGNPYTRDPYSRSPYGRSPYAPGPKGYQRSDERLKEDISDRLMESHHIDSSDVSVDVRSAKVVLEGTVPSRHMQHAIEDLVDACPGVQDVDNRVRVASREELASRTSSPSWTAGSQASQQTSAATGTSTTLSGSAGANTPNGTRSRQ